MKQAILIGAYKHHNQLLKLVSLFPAEHFNIYIHLNKIGEIDYNNFKKSIAHLSHVHVYSQYKIKWGGRNHLLALLYLSKQALHSPDNIYFHYITGQDLPVKSVSYFINELNLTKDYLQTVPYPVSYIPSGTKDWFEYYQFYDLLDAKKYLKYLKLIKNFQNKIGYKRSFDGFFEKKFYGSTYWSLTRSTLDYVINYTKSNPQFLRRLRFTFAAEEIYVTSVIMNSPYASNVVNDNLRFMKWERAGRGGSPSVLDISDFDAVNSSNKLFARKFESPISDSLSDTLLQVNEYFS